MKHALLLVFLLFSYAENSFAQSADRLAVTEEKSKFFGECDQAMNITLGYVPKSSVSAIKAGIAWNNFLFKRVGAYTTFEKGFDSDYFTNIYGLTLSVHEKIYLYGGADLFTQYGVFSSDAGGVRKEMGIGIIPWKMLVVNLGWSEGVGIAIGAGISIPL